MRKKGRRPPYEASETQVESGRIQEGRTKEGFFTWSVIQNRGFVVCEV